MLVFCSFFFSNFEKPNEWLIDNDNDSNSNRLSDQNGASVISTLDNDEKRYAAQFELKYYFVQWMSISSQSSFFEFSIHMIGG